MESISDTIIRYAYVPVVITAAYAAIIYKKLGQELRIISVFIFLSALVQIVSTLLWYQSENNLWLLHIYVAAGFLVLTRFYNSVLKGFIHKKVLLVIAVLFTIFTILNAVIFQGIFTYASMSLTVESILIIILSLSTFTLLLDDLVKESKATIVTSVNWINSGLFLYYSSSLLLFYFGELIMTLFSRNANLYTWVVHFAFLTIMHACFFIGLWNRPRS